MFEEDEAARKNNIKAAAAKKADKPKKKKKTEQKGDPGQENYDDGLSPSQRMDAIKDIFIKSDLDGDKLLTLEEWKACTKKKDGDKYDEAACIEEFKLIDQSNSGSISLAELDLFIKQQQMEAVRDRFKNADSSGDRKLDKKEFVKFFKSEGMRMRAINVLWKKCDVNGDQNVSYTEFSEWMEREMADGVM